jgi:hypothetical protein
VNGWGGQYRPPTWRQPVGWGALNETPPVITAPVVRESPGDWLFNGLLRPAWAYRLELALFGLVSVAYVWLGERFGRAGAERLIVAAAFVVATVTWTREPLAHALFRSHLPRRWALACRHAELATRNDRIPRITRCRLTRAGELLRVRVPAGSQVPDLEAQAERIAAFFGVREVRVTRSKSFTRKVDAERFLVAVEDAKLRGAYVDPAAGRVPFREWAERWERTTATLRPSTCKDYATLLKNQVGAPGVRGPDACGHRRPCRAGVGG